MSVWEVEKLFSYMPTLWPCILKWVESSVHRHVCFFGGPKMRPGKCLVNVLIFLKTCDGGLSEFCWQ
jgi:hypothetical protein